MRDDSPQLAAGTPLCYESCLRVVIGGDSPSAAMTNSKYALLSFFQSVALKDEMLLAALQANPRFTVDPTCWSFTIPDLYFHLRDQGAPWAQVAYKQFRKLLFSTPINRSMKSMGAEITIRDNHHSVDRSRYALIWSSE